MLRETRKYLEENFETEELLCGNKVFQKRFSGYWKIVLNKYWVDVIMDEMFEKYMLNPPKDRNDVALAKTVLSLYSTYSKKMVSKLKTEKIKPKNLNLKQITILVNNVRDLDAKFSNDMKRLLTIHRTYKLNEDF